MCGSPKIVQSNPEADAQAAADKAAMASNKKKAQRNLFGKDNTVLASLLGKEPTNSKTTLGGG